MNPFAVVAGRVKRAFGYALSLHSPKTTFTAASIGIFLNGLNETDLAKLVGLVIAAKLAVLAHWGAMYCTAVAASGRSVIPAVDNGTGKPPVPAQDAGPP